jgi:hypothetical protein
MRFPRVTTDGPVFVIEKLVVGHVRVVDALALLLPALLSGVCDVTVAVFWTVIGLQLPVKGDVKLSTIVFWSFAGMFPRLQFTTLSLPRLHVTGPVFDWNVSPEGTGSRSVAPVAVAGPLFLTVIV